MNLLRIVTLPGSLRRGSYNRMLLELAHGFLEQAHIEIDRLDLKDFPLPIYDGDHENEHGLPQEAWTLKARLAAAHGIVIASPEYNGSIPGGLKNAIDWTSRGEGNPWAGKVVGLMGATDGPWGTWRGQPHLRQSLTVLGAVVIPATINVPHGPKVWSAEGELIDEKLSARVERFIKQFLDFTIKLKAAT